MDELFSWFETLLAHLKQPRTAWEAVAIVGCLVLAYWLARVLRARAERLAPAGDSRVARIGHAGLRRLVFPLTAVLLLFIARAALAPFFDRLNLLRIAIALMVALGVIRLIVYALRQGFPRAAWLGSFERFIAALVWAVVALHVVGILPGVIDWLDEVGFTVGKSRLTLWTTLQGIAAVGATLLASLWIGGLVENRLMAAPGLDSSLKVVLARISKALLAFVAVMVSLPMVGIELTTLSVFGGALGVGLGFGMQKIASNYVSGFIILLDRSIRLGNLIEVDRFSGEVTQITTRYTVLRGLGGSEALVPNEMLVGTVVLNQTYSNPKVRVGLPVQISYDNDPERAIAIMVEVARAHPRVLDDPEPKGFLVSFADSGINLELGFWIGDPHEGTLGARSDLNREIWRRFKEAGIEIPYPRRDLRVISGESPVTPSR